ncbi:MAG: AbiH family protein [Bacilli bacterium]
MDEQGFLLYPKIDKKIIQDFRELKTLLQNYIKSVVKINEKYSDENSVYKTLNDYDNLIVINFNYTNTLSFYNSNIINVYVHGSVDDEIIFGHNEITDLEFSMFNKHVQTQISETNYKHLLEKAFSKEKFELGDSFDLLILGHSFDSNDFGIFKWVYETFYSHKFIFWNLKYFYNPTDDNWDLISRNSNLNKFYTKYLNSIVNTKSSLYFECLERRMINSSDPIYTGHHEFDFFQRVGNIEKISLN